MERFEIFGPLSDCLLLSCMVHAQKSLIRSSSRLWTGVLSMADPVGLVHGSGYSSLRPSLQALEGANDLDPACGQ